MGKGILSRESCTRAQVYAKEQEFRPSQGMVGNQRWQEGKKRGNPNFEFLSLQGSAPSGVFGKEECVLRLLLN